MGRKPRWLLNALWRLRSKAEPIRNKDGRVTNEGRLGPEEIAIELRKAYLTGKRIAREEFRNAR